MDWSNESLLIVNVIANMGAFGLEEVAKRLAALVLVIYGGGSLAAVILTGFAWRWLRRATAEFHPLRHWPAH